MPFPTEPWRLDDSTSVDDRLVLWNEIADEGMLNPDVQRFALCIAEKYLGRPRFVLAAGVLAAVQAKPYVPDPIVDGRPIEQLQQVAYTLRHGGDCEDLAQLLLAVYRLLGFECAPVWLPQPESGQNHTTVVVKILGSIGDSKLTRDFGEHGWNWAESTIRGALLGEHPYDAADRIRSWSTLGRRSMAA